MRLSKTIVALIAILALAIAGTAMAIPSLTDAPARASTTVVQFDVAEDATRFVSDEV